MGKSIGWSSRGPGFDSQHPYGGLHPSVAPVPGRLMPPSGFCQYQVYTWYIGKKTHGKKYILKNAGWVSRMEQAASLRGLFFSICLSWLGFLPCLPTLMDCDLEVEYEINIFLTMSECLLQQQRCKLEQE